jgi:hypothetical protein
MPGVECLRSCPGCSRHVRCGERACPFCGLGLTRFLRAPEYRLKNRLDRGAIAALGAAFGAAGIVLACDTTGTVYPLYGAACVPPSCVFPGTGGGGQGGLGGQGGIGGAPSNGGTGGRGGEPSTGGSGGHAGNSAGASNGGASSGGTAGSDAAGGETTGGEGGAAGNG